MHKIVRLSSSWLLGCSMFGYSAAPAQQLARIDPKQPSVTSPVASTTLSLPKLLKTLSKRYGVDFNYNYRQLSQQVGEVSVLDRPEAPIETVLTELLSPLGLTFERFQTRTYLIYPKGAKSAALTPATSSLMAADPVPAGAQPAAEPTVAAAPAQQDRIVTGSVVEDGPGTTIPGVSVLVKGTQRGTTTDADGNFRLSIPSGAATLVFSYVGFLSKEVAVGNQTTISVRLAADVKSLNEVVVVGYGTTRRRDLTGSVASVSSKDFVQGQVTNPEQLISGKVAGTAAQQAFVGLANTNWQDAIYQTGQTSDNNLSVTGTLAKMPFRVSGGYLNQTGILKTSKPERFSGSFGPTCLAGISGGRKFS